MIQYLKYYPEKIFELPNGLSIYKSQFVNSDGSRGVVAGPHRVFSQIHKNLGNNHIRTSAYFKEMTKIYNSAYQISLDTSIIGFPLDRNEILFKDSVTLPNQSGSESNEKMVDDLKAGDDKVFFGKTGPKSLQKICGN